MKESGKYFISLMLSVVLMLAGSTFNCQKTKDARQKGEGQKMSGTLREVVDQLREKTTCITLGDTNKAVLVVTPEYGARVIGMSVSGLGGENLLWVNSQISADSFWTATPRGWNLGGARSWIAPEDAFYLDEDTAWFVPAQMDPGSYKLEKSEAGTVVCSNSFSVKNRKGQVYDVKLTRTISVLDKPEAPPKSFSSAVSYVGVKFTHELQNQSKVTFGKDQPYVGLWSLIQVNPSGTMIIPIHREKGQKYPPFRNYGGSFNDFPVGERMWESENVVTVKIDGKFRGKLGFAPFACTGFIAYLSPGADGEGKLFIKEFNVDPNGVYLDHPWGKPSEYGDAIQMYNDHGEMGGFAEMECHGAAKALKPGQTESHTITLSVYAGELDVLKKIAGEVLGLDMEKLKYF